MSLVEIAYPGWSFASLTPLRKVEKGSQLLVVFVVVAATALEEEHMACLDQQHSGKEGQAVVVVEDLPISDLDDSSNLDCIYCLKDHNYSIVDCCKEGQRSVWLSVEEHRPQILATGADFLFMAS